MTAASVYQQLRGHLAYLKLAAAAEALPGELDHATKAELSHTAFLERLLAVEVAATAARRHASLERFGDVTSGASIRTAGRRLRSCLANCRAGQDRSTGRRHG